MFFTCLLATLPQKLNFRKDFFFDLDDIYVFRGVGWGDLYQVNSIFPLPLFTIWLIEVEFASLYIKRCEDHWCLNSKFDKEWREEGPDTHCVMDVNKITQV